MPEWNTEHKVLWDDMIAGRSTEHGELRDDIIAEVEHNMEE